MEQRNDEKEKNIIDDSITNVFLNNFKKKKEIKDKKGLNPFRSKIYISLNNYKYNLLILKSKIKLIINLI